MGVIAIAAGAALGAAIVSCGDQTSSTTETTVPELTTPMGDETETQPVQPSTSTSDTATNTTETSTTSDNRDKTTTSERSPDTETTDKPPPADSAAERFERYCDENPGACD